MIWRGAESLTVSAGQLTVPRESGRTEKTLEGAGAPMDKQLASTRVKNCSSHAGFSTQLTRGAPGTRAMEVPPAARTR